MLQCKAPSSDVVIAPMPFRITLNDQQTTTDDIKYYYYPEPAIMKLNPDRGPTTGGTLVMIEGQDLDPFNDVLRQVNNHNDTFCRFGMEFITPATIYSDTLISCIAPPSPIVRTVLVDVTLNNANIGLNPQDWTDDHLPYTYYAPPYIFDCNPRVGPTSGNTLVTVTGSNFKDSKDITCKFGSKVVPGKFINVNEIQCVSPPVDNPGLVDLSVSLESDHYGQPVKYLYYATPIVESISPICGPTTGYTQITVKGQNFIFTGPGLVRCIFNDDIFTPATVMSETEIKCDSPDIHLNDQLVEKVFLSFAVTLNGKDRSQSKQKLRFGYYKFHQLERMIPNRGPITGDTLVHIYGSHFAQEAVCNVTARYGTSEVISRWHNDTEIIVPTPKVKIPGNAIVQVALNGQQFTDMEGNKNLGGSKFDLGVLRYNYFTQPLVTNFEPKSGPSSGNSTVILYGTGFLEANQTASDVEIFLRFNKTSSGQFVGLTRCYDISIGNVKCLTPAADPDTHTFLELSKNGVDYHPIRNVGTDPNDDIYHFYQAPRVVQIDPKYGPVNDNIAKNITITGDHFKCIDPKCPLATCRFGTHPYPIYQPAHVLDQEHMKCRLPQLSRPEVVSVEISINGKDYTHDNRNYTYYDAFVLDILPHFGRREGGTNISVMGFGFADTDELLCKYGSSDYPLLCNNKPCEVQAKYISDQEIQCPSPAQSQVTYASSGRNIGFDPFAVEVAVRNRQFTNSNVKFQYIDSPNYLDFIPRNGTANGGTYCVATLDFHWSNGTHGTNDYEFINRYANPSCIFYNEEKQVVVPGNIITYPFHSIGLPNGIACLSPPWEQAEQIHVSVSVNSKDYGGQFPFEYFESIHGQKIVPACGINEGETALRIEGSGFNDITDLHLKWGTESRPAHLETLFSSDSGVLTAFSPPTPTKNTHGGFIYVEIGHNNVLDDDRYGNYTFYGDYTQDKLLYYYYKDPVIKYIYPHGGPNSGGTKVTVAGAWFINYPSLKCTPLCKFGDKIVPGEFISTVRISCVSPPQNGLKSAVPFALSFNGVDWTDGSETFVYYDSPSISYIQPISGPSSGGTMIGLYGANFTGLANPEEFLCRFRATSIHVPDKMIPAFFKNENLVYCTSPGGWGSGTAATIDLTFNGEDFTNSNSTFYFFQIDGAKPRSGPTSGSELGIQVYGSGFTNNPNATCVIGKHDYKPLKIEWNQMLCPLPPADEGEDFFGSVNFEVTVNGADYQKFQRGFQYYRQPIVTDIEPNRGPITGGSILRVYGDLFRANFSLANLTCAIGQDTSPAHQIDSNTIECLTPIMQRPDNSTKLPASVAINGQDFTEQQFLYEVYGTLDAAPMGGPIEGGTSVLINGYGFSDKLARCRFGIDENNIIVDAKYLDSEHIICIAPSAYDVPKTAKLPLDIPLEVGFSEVKYNPWTKTAHKYRYYKSPKILSISPNQGFIDVQQELNVTCDATSEFFIPLTTWSTSGEVNSMNGLVCRFGNYGSTPAIFKNRNEIICITPETDIPRADLHQDTVILEISLNGQDFSAGGDYTFKGTASGIWVVLMWLGMVIMAALIIVLLVVCCYYIWQNVSMPQINWDDIRAKSRRQDPTPNIRRPHVFRDETGYIKPQNSPMRPSVYQDDATRFQPSQQFSTQFQVL